MTRAGRALLMAALAACAPAGRAAVAQASAGDAALLPAGYGSLKRDDIAITVQVQGLTIRAIPLDESVIRALAPDSYNSLRALRDSKTAEVDRVRLRLGLPSLQLWHLSYFNVQQGEARYDPRDVQIRSAGRDFRPLEVIALVPGFGDGRLAQARSVDAIFLFDPAVVLSQPLVVTLSGQTSSAWNDEVLHKLDLERAAIWSRAAAARKP